MARYLGVRPETATSLTMMWKANQAARAKPREGTMKKGSVDKARYLAPTFITP